VSQSHGRAVSGVVAFILKGYPRLSETFIAQEIRALEERGLDILIVSLRRPTDRARHPVHGEIRAAVRYLPEYLHEAPLRLLGAWLRVRRWPRYREARRLWLRDLARNRSRNRIRRFGQALILADELPAGVERLHAHFLHTPASVARYASRLTGLGWSCSAHAKDIWTTPDWETREKLADADWVVACTKAGRDHLASLAPDDRRVSLAYHGLDLDRFPAPNAARRIDAGANGNSVVILSVGRAVAKKGFDDLLDAIARLPREPEWRFVHVGGGPLLPALKRRAMRRRLDRRVMWLGPQPQDVVLSQYRAADLFVLASRVQPDGDRDGLPNVLLEAQSQGVPCVATRVSAIPELIEDGKTGVLVAEGDVAALADSIGRLIADPGERARLGEAGQRHVRGCFSQVAAIETLAAKFGLGAGPCESRSTPR